MDRDNIAKTIKVVLAFQGISRKALSEMVNIDRITIGRFLRREIDLLPDDINKIYEKLDVRESAEKICRLLNEEKKEKEFKF